MTFHEWNQLFNAQNLFAFNGNTEGLLWLKVRAVCRGKLLKLFLETNNISLSSKTAADKNNIF